MYSKEALPAALRTVTVARSNVSPAAHAWSRAADALSTRLRTLNVLNLTRPAADMVVAPPAADGLLAVRLNDSTSISSLCRASCDSPFTLDPSPNFRKPSNAIGRSSGLAPLRNLRHE